jgi:hypothetical protein
MYFLFCGVSSVMGRMAVTVASCEIPLPAPAKLFTSWCTAALACNRVMIQTNITTNQNRKRKTQNQAKPLRQTPLKPRKITNNIFSNNYNNIT